MSAGAVLEELRLRGIHLEAAGLMLRVNAPEDAVTD